MVVTGVAFFTEADSCAKAAKDVAKTNIDNIKKFFKTI
jgi:hypothetical protein